MIYNKYDMIINLSRLFETLRIILTFFHDFSIILDITTNMTDNYFETLFVVKILNL